MATDHPLNTDPLRLEVEELQRPIWKTNVVSSQLAAHLFRAISLLDHIQMGNANYFKKDDLAEWRKA